MLPGFTRTANVYMSEPPDKGNNVTGPITADFAGGRLLGLLSNFAISGPDRALEDQYERSLGYSPGPIPLVPLSGRVVRDGEGSLEVYESVYVYRTLAGANAWREWLTGGVTAVDAPGMVSGTMYYRAPQSSGPNPPYEGDFEAVALFGTTIVRIDSEGGARMTTSDAVMVVDKGIERLRATCAGARYL